MAVVITEKRLYETPAGELVEELEDYGSLFCGVGAELTGKEAERYLSYVGKPAAKAAIQAEDKQVASAEDKGAASKPRPRKPTRK